MTSHKRNIFRSLLLSSSFALAGAPAWSQSKVIHYTGPINHPAINVSSPYISLEGRSILFVSDNAEDKVLTVFWSTRPDGVVWKEPVPLPKTLNGRLNFLRGFSLSPDGRQTFISTTKGGGLGGFDLYVSNLKGTYWDEPMNVGQPVNSKENEASASITTDGTKMYFMRCTKMDPNKASGCRILVSSRRNLQDRWQAPTELPAIINTGNSQAPRIMGDGESLIFSSDLMGGKGGMDLFITKKQGDNWSKPVPLDFVNTPKDDQYVSASSLGRHLVMDAPTKAASEIVEVLFPVELKPKAVMKIEGRVEGPPNPASPYVNLYDKNTRARLQTIRPTKDGSFVLFLIEGNAYNVVIDPEEDNYTFFSHEYDLTGEKISTLEKLEAKLKPVAAGDIIELSAVDFKDHSTEITESSKTELKKVARLINGVPSLTFELKVFFDGYQKDSIQSNPDLTEMHVDSVHVAVDSVDSVVVKKFYHNDRTQYQALEVVNYLMEQGVPANRLKPAVEVVDLNIQNRKRKVSLIARQQ